MRDEKKNEKGQPSRPKKTRKRPTRAEQRETILNLFHEIWDTTRHSLPDRIPYDEKRHLYLFVCTCYHERLPILPVVEYCTITMDRFSFRRLQEITSIYRQLSYAAIA